MNWNFTDNSSWIHQTRRHWFKATAICVLGGLAVQSELRQQEILKNSRVCAVSENLEQGRAAVARVAHNHEVAGSIPAPATNSAVSPSEPDAPQGGANAPGSAHLFSNHPASQ